MGITTKEDSDTHQLLILCAKSDLWLFCRVKNNCKYRFGTGFVKVLTPYWCTTQCVRTQRYHEAELLSCIIVGSKKSYHSMKKSIILQENLKLWQIRNAKADGTESNIVINKTTTLQWSACFCYLCNIRHKNWVGNIQSD